MKILLISSLLTLALTVSGCTNHQEEAQREADAHFYDDMQWTTPSPDPALDAYRAKEAKKAKAAEEAAEAKKKAKAKSKQDKATDRDSSTGT